MKKLAYSYIRFSNQEQAEGDSLDRQTTRAREYASTHGMTLDETLTLRDLGISGFTGKNLVHGALGVFMKHVKEGRIARGSYLLVEDVDRLGRLPVMEALSVFQTIINAGITVVTLKDGASYSTETLSGDWTRLLPVLVSMGRGHEESATKSDRIREGWAKLRRDARTSLTPLGDLAPSWLSYVAATADAPAHYAVNEQRVSTIKLIFQLCIDGLGMVAISQELRRREIASFGKPKRGIGTWSGSSLQRLLRNRALLGEYQPHVYRPYVKDGVRKRKPERAGEPISGFYPIVLDQFTFQAAANALESRRRHTLTRTAKEFNVWAGIVKCSHCGGALHLSKREHRYLVCYRARLGACVRKGTYVRLDVAEQYFRELLVKVDSMPLVETSNLELEQAILQAQLGLSRNQQDFEYYRSKLQEHDRSQALLDLMLRAEEAVLACKSQIAALEATRAVEQIIDKDEFFRRLNLVEDEGRRKANRLLKDLKIKVWVDGYTFHIYQQDEHLFTLHNGDRGKVDFIPHHADAFEKMKIQDSPSLHDVMEYHRRRRAKQGVERLPARPLSASDIESDKRFDAQECSGMAGAADIKGKA